MDPKERPRPRITLAIAAAVAALFVIAGVDALRSSKTETVVPTATESTTSDIEARRSPKQEIEETANRWAWLFAAGRECNRFMGQPACEWVSCVRPGHRLIADCTPVSLTRQRSFAGAVVQEIVIKEERAAVRFSNGETVRFAQVQTSWRIDRVGAGQTLFDD